MAAGSWVGGDRRGCLQSSWTPGWTEVGEQSLGDQEGVWGLQDTAFPYPLFAHRSPKDVGDVIALSDITPSGAADHSQEPSPVGSRRGHITPNLSRASSDADHGVSRKVEERGGSEWERPRKAGGGIRERD